MRRYAKVFWERVHELSDGERIVQRVEEGEQRRQKQQYNEKMLRRKVQSYTAPLHQLKLTYAQTRGKAYSEDEDRFLIVRLADYGLSSDDVYERIRLDVLHYPEFRFNWFIKSRTPVELARRCNTLLMLVVREEEELEASRAAAKKPKKRSASAENKASPRPTSRRKR